MKKLLCLQIKLRNYFNLIEILLQIIEKRNSTAISKANSLQVFAFMQSIDLVTYQFYNYENLIVTNAIINLSTCIFNYKSKSKNKRNVQQNKCINYQQQYYHGKSHYLSMGTPIIY